MIRATCLLAALLVSLAAATARGDEAQDVAALQAAVKALEQKVASLEQELTELRALREAVAKARQTGRPVIIIPLGANAINFGPGPIAPGGAPVTERTLLNVGDPVDVNWNDQWWKGEVLSVIADGTVKIHYTGWSDDWDEVVPRSRLRLPNARAR
jgi:hypothetical protein